MYRDYLMIINGLSMVLLFSFSCRTTGKPKIEAVSESQKRIVDVLNPLSEHIPAYTNLSKTLGCIFDEFQQSCGISLPVTDSLFRVKMDSAVLYLSSRLFMQTNPEKIVAELNDYIFKRWKITFNNDRKNIEYLLPQLLLNRKQGSCVGMSLLYLMLAEKLGIPFFGVLAPGHMFVRFDNGNNKINIETLHGGECMSTLWYRKTFITDDTLRYPMTNLTIDEVIGVIYYNLGTICFHEKRYDQAIDYLERSVARLHNFPEALGNWALALDARGESKRALGILTEIKLTYPSFDNIDNNLAPLQLKCEKYRDAFATYSGLSRKQPRNPFFHYGCGTALYRMGKIGEAKDELTQAVKLHDDFKEAKELLYKIEKKQLN